MQCTPLRIINFKRGKIKLLIHTQQIENTWMLAKRKHKKHDAFSRTLLESHLKEFMWRQEFGDEPFKNLVLQINTLYPVG